MAFPGSTNYLKEHGKECYQNEKKKKTHNLLHAKSADNAINIAYAIT